MGRNNPWSSIYDPARKVAHEISDFVTEQANTLSQYGEWVTGGEIESAREIAAGEGAIVHDGTRKLSVYRDEYGELHALSAKCTHLGCVVHWSSAERSRIRQVFGVGIRGQVLPFASPLVLQL
jgi:Rieske Fe-S protein